MSATEPHIRQKHIPTFEIPGVERLLAEEKTNVNKQNKIHFLY